VECDQLKPERLDLAEHAVQGGLIGQLSGQDGVAALRDSAQGREGTEERAAEDSPDGACQTD
jgi:hypothetical protein